MFRKYRMMILLVPKIPLGQFASNSQPSRQAQVNPLRELQSASGEELSALMPSVLDRAFKVNYDGEEPSTNFFHK
jgi:hypothetical protein